MTTRCLILTVILMFLIAGCGDSKKRGKTIHGVVFLAEDSTAYQPVRDDFNAWITRGGFSKLTSPDAMSDWSGFKEDGQSSTWYALEKSGEEPIRLRMNLTPHRNKLSVDLDWLHDGPKEDYEELEQRVREFHKDMMIWFLVRDEKNRMSQGNVEALSVWN